MFYACPLTSSHMKKLKHHALCHKWFIDLCLVFKTITITRLLLHMFFGSHSFPGQSLLAISLLNCEKFSFTKLLLYNV